MKKSTVTQTSNICINYAYILFLFILAIGFAFTDDYVLFNGNQDASSEQEEEQDVLKRWIGNAAALWWLLCGYTVMHLILSATICRALWNFWIVFGVNGQQEIEEFHR